MPLNPSTWTSPFNLNEGLAHESGRLKSKKDGLNIKYCT